MVKVFNLFLILGFLISEHFAAYNSATITAKRLGYFAAEIELNKALIQHLQERNSSLRIPLSELRVALEGFEEAFYRKEVLSGYCRNPKYQTTKSDILSAAYGKDLSNPFSEGYNLKLLAVEDINSDLRSVSTLNELKRLGLLNKVIAMVKKGTLHFKSDFEFGYVSSVKDDIRSIIIKRMGDEFSKKFIKQIGYTMSITGICHRFFISPSSIGRIGSIMTLQMAKSIFIHRPFIKFEPK